MEKTWRALLEDALMHHARLAHSRFASLATVRPDGRPSNRTVVFRMFASDDRLMFTSDARSAKFEQFARQPWVELCWYFQETRQQFRLSGPIQSIVSTRDEELIKARQRTWHERAEASRQTFTWPQPGQPRAPDSEFGGRAPDDPPGNFCLLLLTPHQVELLDLRQHPHERRVFHNEDGNWRSELINP